MSECTRQNATLLEVSCTISYFVYTLLDNKSICYPGRSYLLNICFSDAKGFSKCVCLLLRLFSIRLQLKGNKHDNLSVICKIELQLF